MMQEIKIKACSSLVFAISSGLFVLGAAKNDAEGSVAILFAIPLAAQLIGLGVLYFTPLADKDGATKAFHIFYLVSMLLCQASYCVLWLFFRGSWKSEAALSVIALALIFLLLVLVGIITLSIMSRATGESGVAKLLSNFRDGVSNMPFWALLHFFTIFLTVSYLFGFAFAFYDQSVLTESLQIPPLYKATLSEWKADSTPAKRLDPACYYQFYFAPGSARLEKGDGWLQDEQVVTRRKNNLENLGRIAAEIDSQSRDNEQIRVVLVGRADEDPIGKQARYSIDKKARYVSNYELSEARAQNVKYEIIENLISTNSNAWRNVDWLLLPLSNEPDLKLLKSERSPLDRLTPNRKRCDGSTFEVDTQAERVVEGYTDTVADEPVASRVPRIRKQPFERLSLMDYMYFSIYTITTTGYGDIVPTDGYTKLIASLANICEVFFMVGFFNALVALQGKRVRPSDSGHDEPARRIVLK